MTDKRESGSYSFGKTTYCVKTRVHTRIGNIKSVGSVGGGAAGVKCSMRKVDDGYFAEY